jgi:hypothetical protein
LPRRERERDFLSLKSLKNRRERKSNKKNLAPKKMMMSKNKLKN